MRPIAEYEPMDRERFEREIVPKGEPALFRGLVADWPVVRAAKDGPEVLAQMLSFAASPRRRKRALCRLAAQPGVGGGRRMIYEARDGG